VYLSLTLLPFAQGYKDITVYDMLVPKVEALGIGVENGES
jgi:hypothetical protein